MVAIAEAQVENRFECSFIVGYWYHEARYNFTEQTFIWNKAKLMDVRMFVKVEQEEAQDTNTDKLVQVFSRPCVLFQSSILSGE